MSQTLLDSNIIIDHLNGIPQAKIFLEKEPDWFVSSITVYEVLSGCGGPRSEQLTRANKFFSFCQIIPVDASVAETAAKLQRKRNAKRKMADFLIAATAIQHDLRIATRNSADFKNVCSAFRPYKV